MSKRKKRNGISKVEEKDKLCVQKEVIMLGWYNPKVTVVKREEKEEDENTI